MLLCIYEITKNCRNTDIPAETEQSNPHRGRVVRSFGQSVVRLPVAKFPDSRGRLVLGPIEKKIAKKIFINTSVSRKNIECFYDSRGRGPNELSSAYRNNGISPKIDTKSPVKKG